MNSIMNMDLKGKRTFIRVDFNVPLKDGVIQDDTRICEALKTIEYAKNAGAKVILASHLGRPKGERNSEMSLKPVADYICNNFFKVKFADDCIGATVLEQVNSLNDGDVILLENLRYHNGEEKNLPEFVKSLSELADVYINDAFGTCHRKHASVYGLPEMMDHKCMGFLVEKEVKYFGDLLKNPEKPFAAILGGAKVSDKMGVIESLMDIADNIIIGGAMAYTFLAFKGINIGNSLVEREHIPTVKNIYSKAADKNVQIFIPIDHICSKEFNGEPIVVDSEEIPDGLMGLDIGKQTRKEYLKVLGNCRTVLWNGPMGVFENEDYSEGTFIIANFIADSDATVIVGGGDSVNAVKRAGIADKMDHISTGGGASLEYIEFGKLPGVEILL